VIPAGSPFLSRCKFARIARGWRTTPAPAEIRPFWITPLSRGRRIPCSAEGSRPLERVSGRDPSAEADNLRAPRENDVNLHYNLCRSNSPRPCLPSTRID